MGVKENVNEAYCDLEIGQPLKDILDSMADKVSPTIIRKIPLALLSIDIDEWKFPNELRTKENMELINLVEQSNELRSLFQEHN